MDWLLKNWVWLAFAVAMVLMMRRGGCCAGHGKDNKTDPGATPPPQTLETPPKRSVDTASVQVK